MKYIERNYTNAIKYDILGNKYRIEGTIMSIKNKNIYTNSKKNIRNWMVLIKNVCINSIHIDHIWLFGCKNIIKLKSLNLDKNVKIQLEGVIGLYNHDGKLKWCLKFPYSNLKIIENDNEDKNEYKNEDKNEYKIDYENDLYKINNIIKFINEDKLLNDNLYDNIDTILSII